MDQQFGTDLETWLSATADRYVVQRTLKATELESTEVVYKRDEQGTPSIGPFVRKRFTQGAGRGGAYEQILRAQASGDRLAHQPIIYECERMGDTLEVVMEYVAGQTLHDYVQGPGLGARGGPGLTVVRKVFIPLCDAADELHTQLDRPLIHRDIKPSNVMITADRVVLIDLGIARTYDERATTDTVRYGTPGYAPPEQFGYGQTSVRSDVYALGMTLAFCLTGRDCTPELRERGFADPRIPASLRPVLVQATQFDPQARYASAKELQRACLAALGDTPEAPARPAEPQEPARRVPHFVGRMWNILVLLMWIGLCAAFAYMPFNPNNKNANSLPTGYGILVAIGVFIVPITCICYLLLDKRRLRGAEPLSRYTWRQEVPFCIGVGVISFVLTIVIYSIARTLLG